jgi:hypothetical protein
MVCVSLFHIFRGILCAFFDRKRKCRAFKNDCVYSKRSRAKKLQLVSNHFASLLGYRSYSPFRYGFISETLDRACQLEYGKSGRLQLSRGFCDYKQHNRRDALYSERM